MDFAGRIVGLNAIVGKSMRHLFTSELGGKSRKIVVQTSIFNDFPLN